VAAFDEHAGLILFCCAPLASPEARHYLGALSSAANFAFANRQLVTHWVHETFAQVLQRPPKDLHLDIIYDGCHNIGKVESHVVEGQTRRLCVHCKGAALALPA
jgi:tRNA-splicing ligase RtcB (3'-phosphate/5'-hydroxy nucleic acid ligase)